MTWVSENVFFIRIFYTVGEFKSANAFFSCTHSDNINTGYVQGMSDLLSPLYMVIGDDLVFQAFVGFMNRTVSNTIIIYYYP